MKKYILVLFSLSCVVNWLLSAQDLTDVRIFINPGHGGYDSDDRNVVIAPFASGDIAGFWESKSNLDKGLMLKEMLEEANAKAFISRTQNRTEDDLKLSVIVEMANQADADFMVSIHSNAGGTANHVLQLYAGIDPGDTYNYKTPTPCSEEGREICLLLAENQYSNQANVWGNQCAVRGDKTFARTAMKWSDGYGVLRGLTLPGTISEGSMHDYIPETYRLMNMDYKWLEAWHFMKTFATYFKKSEIPTGNIVGTIHDAYNLNMGDYPKIADSKDLLLPLEGAKVTLTPGNMTYTTDNMHNGIYVFKNLLPGKYVLKYEMANYYTQEMILEVKSNMTTYNNVFLNMIRQTPPEVINYSPKVTLDEPVICSTPIAIDFNWDVDIISARQAFSIEPFIAGKITFENSNHRLIFTPDLPYEKQTIYTVTLDKSLKHPDNLNMLADFTFQFKTQDRNRLKLLYAFPNGYNTPVYYNFPKFEFVFDKTLAITSCKSAFEISDSNGNILTQNLRSISYNKVDPNYGSVSFILNEAFLPGEIYQMRIKGTLEDIDGIAMIRDTVYYFKADSIVKDVVPTLSLESENRFTYVSEESKNVESASVQQSSDQKIKGTYSSKLSYSFIKEGYALYRFLQPISNLTVDHVIGAYIYGNLSFNELDWEVRVVSDQFRNNQVIYIPMACLDYLNWNFKECKLSDLNPNNQYQLTGIRIRHITGINNAVGNFYLDDLSIYDELVNSLSNVLIENWQIYPNPASDYIEVDLKQDKLISLQLYSLEGILIRETFDTSMNIADLESGNYLLQIITKARSSSRKILINKRD